MVSLIFALRVVCVLTTLQPALALIVTDTRPRLSPSTRLFAINVVKDLCLLLLLLHLLQTFQRAVLAIGLGVMLQGLGHHTPLVI